MTTSVHLDPEIGIRMDFVSYNVGTININNITNQTKIAMLQSFVRSTELDVIFLQEVENSDLDLPGFDIVFNIDERKRGTAIAVKHPLHYENIHRSIDARLISIKVGGVTFINVYAPAGAQNKSTREIFFNTTVAHYLQHSSETIVLGGDFNSVVNVADSTGSSNYSPMLKRLMSASKLIDTWSIRNKNRVEFSYVRTDSASRLDRILVRDTMQPWVRNAYFTANAFSDHKAYVMRITLPSIGRTVGRGVWRLMPQILDEPDTMTELERKWVYWVRCRRQYQTWMDWWLTFCKPKLQSFLKWRTSIFYNDFRGTMEIYNGCLNRAYAQLLGNPEQQVVINRIKAQMLQLQRNFSTTIRRHNSTYIAGEQTSVFHLQESSSRRSRTCVKKLSTQDGRIMTTSEDIEREIVNYFQNLYGNSETQNGGNFVPHRSIPRDNISNNTIMRRIEEEDVLTTIKASCSKKSPGSDGLPKEFYLKTWRIISREITLVLNEALEGNTPKKFLDGIIVLVKKKGNRNNMLSGFRPISLLNFDFKLLSKIIKHRMTPLLPLVLSSHQKCANGSRNIFEATTRIFDKICETKHRKENRLLVSFDLDHAFDRVDHQFLCSTLHNMNLNHNLINLLSNIWRNSFSKIMVNGRLSSDIHIQRSVRQGDPLSMICFVLYIQPLIDKIVQTFPRAIICAYADDISMFMDNERMLERVTNIFNDFGIVAGAVLNRHKTVGLMLGNVNLTERTEWLTIENSIKILGIFYSENTRTSRDQNWNAIFAGIQHRIWACSPRNLPLVQKVILLNTYVNSKIWYVASNVYLPKNFEARIVTEIRKFLWIGHPGNFKIAFQNLCLPKLRGGLNLQSPGIKSKAQPINRILQMANELPFASQFLEMSSNPPCLSSIPAEFQHIRLVVQETAYLPQRVLDCISGYGLYQYFVSLLPDPTVVMQAPRNWKSVFQTIHSKILTAEQKSTWYLIIHERIRHNVLLHHQNPDNSQFCDRCPTEEETVMHRLFKCNGSRRIWMYQKRLFHSLEPNLRRAEPERFIYPDFQRICRTMKNRIVKSLGALFCYIINNAQEDQSIEEYQIYVDNL